MRGRTVVSKVLQNMGTFRKGLFQELCERPNLVLRYGSFDPTKRAEALARAGGELGAAVRALTSEGVLEAKDHIDKLKELHSQEDHLMVPDRLVAQRDTPSMPPSHQLTSCLL